MHAVINHLPIKDGTDWAELTRKVALGRRNRRRAAQGIGLKESPPAL